jgi:hypothetical protein
MLRPLLVALGAKSVWADEVSLPLAVRYPRMDLEEDVRGD